MKLRYPHTQYIRRIAVLLILVVTAHIYAPRAIADTDSIRISLLTCAPGEEIYSLFGHTAIRYEDSSKGIDVVFNYGLFDFNTPNFVYRFVKGETYYRLGVSEFQRFKSEYAYHNRAVWQQTLNLTEEEEEALLQALQLNYLPENRVYHYNFFFDNCATRPRDKIEESIAGKVVYHSVDNRQSFRDIVHESAKGYEWDRFGMDFCLGAPADKPISYREEMFHPFYLMDAFANATIVDKEGRERPLVNSTAEIVSKQDFEEKSSFPLTPMRSTLLFFILITAATIYGVRKKKALWGIDLFLFALAGLAGSIIAFLSCFSVHPAVCPNYLIFIFHPLHILLLPFVIRKEIKGLRSYYHLANVIVLTLFILIWPIIPQYFDLAVLPLALCLLVRSASNLILTYKKEK